MAKRIGIFGGTFDPVHYGHLLLAEQCREQCALDQVWFLPAGVPPHKTNESISPGPDRAAMLDLAVAGQPQFAVKTLELDRAGPSYTADTLAELHEQHPDYEWRLLIGADSLRDLPTWYRPERILTLATIVAVNRGDRPLPSLDPLRELLGEDAANRIRFAEMPGIDLSATDIRRRVRQGKSIRFMAPRAVEQYVVEHGLYQPD